MHNVFDRHVRPSLVIEAKGRSFLVLGAILFVKSVDSECQDNERSNLSLKL